MFPVAIFEPLVSNLIATKALPLSQQSVKAHRVSVACAPGAHVPVDAITVTQEMSESVSAAGGMSTSAHEQQQDEADADCNSSDGVRD